MVSDSNPSIRATGGFSPIWVIPIVALVIGLWMVVQTKLSEGPDISISFDTAEGLEVGKLVGLPYEAIGIFLRGIGLGFRDGHIHLNRSFLYNSCLVICSTSRKQ